MNKEQSNKDHPHHQEKNARDDGLSPGQPMDGFRRDHKKS
jgi:hypothetical protein